MIYLDHAATTPMDPRVIEAVTESMRRDFANSGTRYKIGLDAKKKIEEAAGEIARLLDLPSTHRIVFTGGGSESNNLFIKGLCFPEKKVAYSGLEHPSVTEALAYFKNFGNEPLNLLRYQKEGRFDPESTALLKENRVRLLCLSHVNNELGTVSDPETVLQALRTHSPQTRLFLDGVQALGKIQIAADVWRGLAGYSLSGHKIKGPKGIGMLIYDSRLSLAPLIHGGKQQYGVRSGTLPVPLIIGMKEAVKFAVDNLEETRRHLYSLRRALMDGLRELSLKWPYIRMRFNSLETEDIRRQSPAIVNFSFPPVEGEVILHHLEEKDIFVGLGSACSAHSKEPSKILTGIGRTEEEARCSLRISFGRDNKIDDVHRFLKEFSRAYQALYPSFSQNSAKQ